MYPKTLICEAGKLAKYRPRFNATLGLTGVTTAKQVREKLEPFRGCLGHSLRVLDGDMAFFFRSSKAMKETADCDWTLALPVGPDGTEFALKFEAMQLKHPHYFHEISWEFFCIYHQGKIYNFRQKRCDWIVMAQQTQVKEK